MKSIFVYVLLLVLFECESRAFGLHWKPFINTGAELCSASQSFGQQVCERSKRSAHVIRNFCCISHFNIYGFQKGSVTHASSTTTCPSVHFNYNWWQWTIGKVLGFYFQFAAGEDFDLDQLLSHKDPNSMEFDTLSVHWHDSNIPLVIEAPGLTFGCFLRYLSI